MASADLAPEDDTLLLDEALGDTLAADADFADALTEEAAARLAAEEAMADEMAAADAEVEEASGAVEQATLILPGNATRRVGSSARAEAAAAREQWKRLGESVKPPHLRVPLAAYDIVDKLIQPCRQDPADVVLPPPRHGTGPLEPRSNVDSTVVRAFIHRIDRNHDDLIEPFELSELSVKRNLGITEEQIMCMFGRIIDKRAPGKRDHAGISWLEIFNEMKVAKRWMRTTDLSVTCEDGQNYHVATEQETLERWCSGVQSKFASDYPDLEMPTSWSPAEIERLFGSLLSVRSVKDGKPLQAEIMIQSLLKSQGEKASQLTNQPRIFSSVAVAGQRQAWGWESLGPYRALWLRFFQAAGLKPLHPLPLEAGKAARNKADEEAKIRMVIPPNVAQAQKSIVGKEGKVKVREPRPKVAIREDGSSRQKQSSEGLLQPWEEKRMHSESLVNSSISKGVALQVDPAAAQATDDGYPSADATLALDAGATNATVSLSFDARQRFLQVTAKHGRDSEQQRCIGKEKQEMARQASLLGQAGASVANIGIKFRGPHGHLGFSHHHQTSSVDSAVRERKYDKELGHSWDGTHIDHSRLAPQKEDVKLSKMSPEERARQFNSYYTKTDNQAARVNALDGVKDIMEPYKSWQNHEFRLDHPHRHGKYGRRIFDPQVRENQLPHTISGIESKPMEEFNRQQDLVHEFLDRSLPVNQSKPFEQYLPPAEFAYRKEVDLMGRHMTGLGNWI